MRRQSEQILLALCLLAAFCKFWPSDRWLLTSSLSYFPTVLNLLITLVLLIWSRRNYVVFLGLLPILLFTFYKENERLFQPSPAQAKSLRIFQWNVWGARRGAEAITRVIAAQQPDIVCLNEPKRSIKERLYPPYAKLLGGNWYSRTEFHMAILSRFPISRLHVSKSAEYRGLLFRIESPSPITVFMVDVSPKFKIARPRAFEEMRHELSALPKLPDVIAGDLNTPSLSYSLNPLHSLGYVDCYQIAGSGIAYTWPVFLPMMRIDFILTQSDWRIGRQEIGFTTLSDHAWQWADFLQR